MNDRRIVALPQVPQSAVVLALLGLALLLGGAVTAGINLALGAVLPLVLAAVLLATRDRAFAARITEDAIEIETPAQTIRFADLQGVRAIGRPADPYKIGPRHYAIHVVHRGGSFRIPPRLDVPSDEVYQFLLRQFQSEDARPIDSRLENYRRRKEDRYGAAHIWCYQARKHLGGGAETERTLAWMTGLFFGSIGWIVFGMATDQTHWAGIGMIFAVVFGLIWFIVKAVGSQANLGITNWPQSSLVICPDGLGLIQGDLQGQLRWDELRKVQFLSQAAGQSIMLTVDGAQVQIGDFYNRPLALIYQHIRYYWKAEEMDFEQVDRSFDLAPQAGSTGITPGFLPSRSRSDYLKE